MNPNQEKKYTRPYLLKGFRTGMDLALPLTGLTSGAFHIEAIVNPISNFLSSNRISSRDNPELGANYPWK